VDVKIGYIVSSYYKYYDCCYPKLLRSLIHSGVNHSDVFGFVADSYNFKDGNIYRIDHNSYDFNALIGVVDNADFFSNKYSHLFLLHDTCVAGKKFKFLVENNFDINVNHTSVCGFMTMGMFKTNYLLEQHDFISSQKNMTKDRAIELEDHFFKSNSKICYNRSKYMPDNEHYIRLRARKYCGEHKNVCYFPYLDLYKMTKY
jgi:hypothetical protein